MSVTNLSGAGAVHFHAAPYRAEQAFIEISVTGNDLFVFTALLFISLWNNDERLLLVLVCVIVILTHIREFD